MFKEVSNSFSIKIMSFLYITGYLGGSLTGCRLGVYSSVSQTVHCGAMAKKACLNNIVQIDLGLIKGNTE